VPKILIRVAGAAKQCVGVQKLARPCCGGDVVLVDEPAVEVASPHAKLTDVVDRVRRPRSSQARWSWRRSSRGADARGLAGQRLGGVVQIVDQSVTELEDAFRQTFDAAGIPHPDLDDLNDLSDVIPFKSYGR